MDEMTSKEAVSNALELKKYEGLTAEQHIRRAVEVADEFGMTKGRVDVDVLRDLLPKAHRVSA